MFRLSEKSLKILATVDPKLQNLIKASIANSPYDFKVIEGIRTLERQKELFAQGFTKTLKSYHLRGKAVDIAVIVNGKVTWDFKFYKPVADHIKQEARKLGYIITWGGDWKSIKDGPHFQIED